MEVSNPPAQRWTFDANGLAPHADISRLQCATNIFSETVLNNVINFWESNGNIGWIEIETGGGYANPLAGQPGQPDRLRWPHEDVPITRLPNQWSCRANSPEWAEASAFYAERSNNLLEGDPPTENWPQVYQQCRINPSLAIWRVLHGMRRVPVTVELSHAAEAYQAPQFIEGFQPTWRVEKAELERDWVNLSRRECSAGALMWRKEGGELIPLDEKETYTGPTLCWHAGMGSPCYAPHPLDEGSVPPRIVTGQSPSKRKIGRSSGGGSGGRDWVARGRKRKGSGKGDEPNPEEQAV